MLTGTFKFQKIIIMPRITDNTKTTFLRDDDLPIGGHSIYSVSNQLEEAQAAAQEALSNQDSSTSSTSSSKETPWYKKLGNWLSGIWDDITGKSKIELQNELEKERMELQYQYDLDAALNQYKLEAEALENAGYNKNLAYSNGGTQVSQQAPQLEAYSGSSRSQRMLQGAMQLMNFIPGVYQAQAGIQKVLQEKIRTAFDWLSLKDKSLEVADHQVERPWSSILTPTLFQNKSYEWLHKRGIERSIPDFYDLSHDYQEAMQGAFLAEYNSKRYNAASKYLANMYDYGHALEGSGIKTSTTPYYVTRNRLADLDLNQSQLNYNIDVNTKEFSKWAGIFSPVIQSLLGSATRLETNHWWKGHRY